MNFLNKLKELIILCKNVFLLLIFYIKKLWIFILKDMGIFYLRKW